MENSGFHVIYRDENRTIEETVALAEKAFFGRNLEETVLKAEINLEETEL